MVVSHQGGFSSGESHRGQSSAGESHQGRSSGVLLGGLLPGWSFIRVVSHHGSVLSSWQCTILLLLQIEPQLLRNCCYGEPAPLSANLKITGMCRCFQDFFIFFLRKKKKGGWGVNTNFSGSLVRKHCGLITTVWFQIMIMRK